MLKRYLMSGSVVVLIWGSGLAIAAQAQTNPASGAGSARQLQPQPAQSSAPPASRPSALHLSQTDLQKFARAFQQIRDLQNQRQTTIQHILEQQSLTQARFNEIAQSQRAAQSTQAHAAAPGSTAMGTPAGRPAGRPAGTPAGVNPGATTQPLSHAVSPAELQHFQQAEQQLQQLQVSQRDQAEQAIAHEGLTVEQFNQIFEAARQDAQLRQQILALIH
ncbi:MAG TPA: DUF4168 domain-containing protein [Chroococcidiopsis sp.]